VASKGFVFGSEVSTAVAMKVIIIWDSRRSLTFRMNVLFSSSGSKFSQKRLCLPYSYRLLVALH
jgi:hypothetical protein